MKKLLPAILAIAISVPVFAQTVTDIEGNEYNTVTLGDQVWMKENLKTTKFNDGTDIPNVTNDAAWAALTTPGYCWLDNNVSNKNLGGYYNWYAANTGKLCPAGWHIPSSDEWLALANQFGGADKCAPHLTALAGGDNSSGFTILFLGARNGQSGAFQYYDVISRFWSSNDAGGDKANEVGTGNAWTNLVYNNPWYKSQGHNVRCLKDANVPVVNVTGITLDPVSDSIKVDETIQLSFEISPENATNKNVTWTTDNSSIATVSDSGLVTGIAAGTAIITATTEDGAKTSFSVITVTSNVGIEANNGFNMQVFPNPFSEKICIRMKEGHGFNFEIYNASGVLVKNGCAKGHEEVISMSQLPASLYFVRILKDNSEQQLFPVMKK